MLIDMRPVIESALELVRPRARAVGVMPVFAPPAAPVMVMAGAVRMEQVVVNLILNALDAVEGRQDGAVTVGLSSRAGRAVFTVAYTGRGIPPGLLSRVAEPFFSTKTGDGSGDGGLGLGLSICKTILAEFGGDMRIESLEGQSTVVTVSLPEVRDVQRAAE
jgi:two-component system C4-dicarboxylate transport sensor histidine kinase DctB